MMPVKLQFAVFRTSPLFQARFMGALNGYILPNTVYTSCRVVVSYKRKYVHRLLVNRLLKPAQEKVWLNELTVPQ